MKTFGNFRPDLIVEVTSVCDRKCVGCYAPNVVSNQGSSEILKQNPEFFLREDRTIKNLNEIIVARGTRIPVVSLRGGEPSRHPHLADLLKAISKYAEKVYLETHGRWIIAEEQPDAILAACAQTHTNVKISFDRMHGLSTAKLKNITSKLSLFNIDYTVAITETDEATCLAVRSTCDWISDENFIFQKKAVVAGELLAPTLGVIRVDGSFSRSLTSHLPAANTKQHEGVA